MQVGMCYFVFGSLLAAVGQSRHLHITYLGGCDVVGDRMRFFRTQTTQGQAQWDIATRKLGRHSLSLAMEFCTLNMASILIRHGMDACGLLFLDRL
ncbi:hypothetical protein B0T18DRAFT_232835 [Schizothecium vesticola]|uniref:Secreted protein n=1 Tax=Schizothecium vesticola TaxID=314040 RepID=A0AA40ELI3_9PEZI|nr:hypothetical protein B0T18DRAFT_232835 [Schizothecium vesticola]